MLIKDNTKNSSHYKNILIKDFSENFPKTSRNKTISKIWTLNFYPSIFYPCNWDPANFESENVGYKNETPRENHGVLIILEMYTSRRKNSDNH